MKHSFFKRALEGNNAIWTYIVGTILVIIGHVLGQIPISILLIMKMFDNGGGMSADAQEKMTALDFDYFGIDPNFGFFLILLSFVVGILALVATLKYIHKRSFLSVITPKSKLNRGKLAFGFFVWLGLAAIGEGLSYYMEPDNYILTFKWSSFIPLLLICIFVLPWQTSFEETFMRGYLMQGLALWTKNPFIPWIITSVIFGLLHGMNPEIGEFGFWKMMIFYIGTGAFLGLITILDESLELALGIHFANNLFGALFVSFDGSALQTPTMFRSLEMDTEYMLVGWGAVVIIFLGLAQLKYKWKNWGKIFQTIDFSDDDKLISNTNTNILDESI